MRTTIAVIAAALAAALPVAVPAGAATLSGRVTNTSGVGVHPLDIDVYDAATGAPVPTAGDSTTATGDYAIPLATGTYRIAFRPAAGSHLFSHTEPALSIQTNKTLDVVLPSGRYLTGRVADIGGAGVLLADLDFRAPTSGVAAVNVEGDRTDSTGAFTALVDLGTWDVSVIAPLAERLVPVRIPGLDLTSDRSLGTVALSGGHLIQGTVTDEGLFPVAGADIDVRPPGGGPKLFTPQDDTAADGSYAFVVAAGTWDVIAAPGGSEPLATATARSVPVLADAVVPNLVLPPGVELRARCQTGAGVAVAGVDVDVDSLPGRLRLDVLNDQSDAGGDVRVLVPRVDLRLTLSPPPSTKLLPVRYDSLHVVGALDLGTVVLAQGWWVSGTVRRAGSSVPVAGANLDFRNAATGALAVTPGDLTDADGFFRVVLPSGTYSLRVAPPGADLDTLDTGPFSIGGDTSLPLEMTQVVTAVESAPTATRFRLAPPAPNPARGAARVGFTADGADVELSVWDVHGRRVALLHHGESRGFRSVVWRLGRGGARPPAGVYFLRLTEGRRVTVRRLVVLP